MDPTQIARQALQAAELTIEQAISALDAPTDMLIVSLYPDEVFRCYYDMGKMWYRHLAGLDTHLTLPANYEAVMNEWRALSSTLRQNGIEGPQTLTRPRETWDTTLFGLEAWIAFQGNVDIDTSRAHDKIAAALNP